MIGSDANDVICDLFKSLLQRYQEHLEEKMHGSEFVFDAVNAFYYDINKISIYRGGSYIPTAEWIKNEKATINPQNKKNDKCFQYSVINQNNCNEIDFPSKAKDWKKFETNNKLISLNILYVTHNTKKIYCAYKSKYNLTRKSQVILVMTTDGKNWHYLAVKSLSALLNGIASNHNGDFYCLNCFRAYTTENSLNEHTNVCENHDYCYEEMPKEDNKILKYNHGEKSMKTPFIIYADLERLLEKMNTFYNNLEKLVTTKINKHAPSGYSLFTHCSFDEEKDKLTHYRGENSMKKFCKDLRKHATKIINYKKKEMMLLTEEEKRNHNKQKVCYICKKGFTTHDSNKEYYEVKDHCHYTGKYRVAAHNICNLRYKIPKEIPIVFHNGSTYDYHFIIKHLAEQFEGEFECLGENTEKYITFSVPRRKLEKRIT